MTRRSKLLLTMLAIGVVLFVWGFFIEPSLLTERDVAVKHWPGPSIKIALITDLHAGAPHIDAAYIEKLVSRINALSPDLILLGGDLLINEVLGGRPMPINELVQILKKLQAPLGVFAVLGNHDWWNDGPAVRALLESEKIFVLENEARLMSVGSHFNFWLVGIGDEYTGHANAATALSQVTSAAPRILLMHDPAAILQLRDRFFLAVAGHMHGGQVALPGIGALFTPGKAPRSWAAGRVELENGPLVVSKGIGTSMLPVRFNAPPEFVILELKAE